MNNYKVLSCALQVFNECNINSFPIDCFLLLEHYGYRVYTYEEIKELNSELYLMCSQYSDDAFRDGNSMIIAYNEDKPYGRIRFSLMHELGHHIPQHKQDCFENEKEANAFASNILAPRMAIHYSNCKNYNDVRRTFKISPAASKYAFDDYRRWRRLAVYNMKLIDKKMYTHFYNANAGGFVWKISNCDFCGKELYNAPANRCQFCKLPDEPLMQADICQDDNDIILSKLHQKWLYTDCY